MKLTLFHPSAHVPGPVKSTSESHAHHRAAAVPRRKSSSASRRMHELLGECDIQIDGPGSCDIQVHDQRFYSRVLLDGSLGLGESYMDQWWSVRDLDGFIYRLLAARLDRRVWSWRDVAAYASTRVFNLQTPGRAFQVGEQHYDLGNDLYEAMLDPLMIYSCGYWKDATTLQAAQQAKLDLVFQKLDLRPGQRVLDIGCGWGGALRYAAERYGVEGVGITVSEEQAAYARSRCSSPPITIRLEDYRNLRGEFDHIYSIGMFEHVGAKNYRTYLQTARRHLKQGGRFLLHSIGTMNPVGHPDPWLEKYIFPNSVLPSQRQIVQAIEGLFAIEGWQRIGKYYDPTLLAWRANFEANWPRLRPRRNDRFYRMWRYYLSACAGSFRAGNNDVWQVLLAPLP